MMQLAERSWAGRHRLVNLVGGAELAGWCQRTIYLKPGSPEPRRTLRSALPADEWRDRFGYVLEQVGESETGVVLFTGAEQVLAVVPPFPIAEDSQGPGVHGAPLVELLRRDLLIGVVLLRLGRFAVGVLRGDALVASKTGSRYVKRRHRAGGSSQRRFERSRERLVRELFDKACEVVKDVVSPHGDRIDYILLGGESHTLRGLVRRCGYLQALHAKTLERVLPVERPGQRALEGIAHEVWKSRVLVFSAEPGG
jgi:hypothetical protein